MSQITLKNRMLAVVTPYAPDLVAALKTQVPGDSRKWDGAAKTWLVDPQYGPVVQALIRKHLGEQCALPAAPETSAKPELRLMEVRYLGRVKQRQDGTETAYAWVDGGWNAIFAKAVLWAWFGQTNRPGEAATLYQVLGVQADADGAAIKAAWKRLARQWHPDTCREPDAAGQFRAIKDAYDILGDDGKRARYDAGRALEASLRAHVAYDASDPIAALVAASEWAPPLRNGWIMVKGIEKMGRFVAAEILEWQDIVRGDGAVLVASWPMGADKFTEEWVL